MLYKANLLAFLFKKTLFLRKYLKMQGVLFYLTYPFIYLIASLPFGLLYKFSDFLYFILKLSGYRKDVVYNNLKKSFPVKTHEELDKMCETYFRYLCDLILETLKTLTMTEKEASERCVFHDTLWLRKLREENRSIIIVMGHYGNWEWAGPSFILGSNYQLVVIYRPLSNPYFEKMLCKTRTKFGTRITPVQNTLRDMVTNRKQVTATAFIADQTAFAETGYWTTFLNQDTAVFTGPEKLSKKFDYPVVYMGLRRTKRGFYEINPELLIEKPVETAENEISEVFTKRLEKDIVRDPSIWLWSHRRWKYTRQK